MPWFSCSVVVSTLDFESSIPGSNPGRRKDLFLLVFHAFINISLYFMPRCCGRRTPNPNPLSHRYLLRFFHRDLYEQQQNRFANNSSVCGGFETNHTVSLLLALRRCFSVIVCCVISDLCDGPQSSTYPVLLLQL